MARPVVSCVLVVLAVVGCTGEAGTKAPGPSVDLSNDIEITSSQPFAGFPVEKMRTLEEIRRKLVYRCMVERRYRYYEQADPEAAPRLSPLLTLDRELVGWATEAHARGQGFGTNLPAVPAKVVASNTNHDKVLRNCVAEFRRKTGPHHRKVFRRAGDLRDEMSREYSDAVDSARLDELKAPVVECLADAGFDAEAEKRERFGLRPETFGIERGGPEGGQREPRLKREPGTIEVLPASPARRYVPSAKEAELAVAMFRCQHETGAVDVLRALVNDAQQVVWNRHEDELAELKKELAALVKAGTELL
ncbi:hypothetical protein ABGB12_22175 [Actinocorallia sp. B10E7]|uniref:hypothetical protein n=1 Tax=Actinocorallia sp. B10E7 TaxID=3153558 RepID=UPI00325CB14E